MHKTETKMMVAWGCRGKGSEKLLFNGYRVSVQQNKKGLEIGCTTV